LYRDLLGRPAEASGLAYWAGQLDQSGSRAQVALGITRSPEYRTDLVQSLYSTLLLRPADAVGLAQSVQLLNAGGTVAQFKAVLAGSPEYFLRRGGNTDTGFLAALYLDFLGRVPDASGAAAYSALLARGGSRADVAGRVVGSAEAAQGLVQSNYQRFLRRPADEGGLSAAVAVLQAGVAEEALLAGLLGSDEYLAGLARPPGVSVQSPGSGLSSQGNITITGRVSGTPWSGVAALQAQVDGPAAVPVAFDAAGNFQFVTALPLDGSADGAHTVHLRAINQVGVESPSVDVAFTLVTNGVNRTVTAAAGVQQMPSVAVDPADPDHVVTAYMDYSLVTTGYAGIGVAVSDNAGTTWQRTAIPLPAGFAQGAANPIAHFDDRGHVFVSFMAATFLGQKPGLTNPSIVNDAGVRERTLGMQANNGVFVARSDDGGLTWNPPVTVVSHLYDGQHQVPFDIMPDLAVDTFRTLPNGQPNPNYDNLYAVWSRYYPPGQFPGEPTSTGGSEIEIAVSRDGGQSWQTQLQPEAGTGVADTVLPDSFHSGIGIPAGLGASNWSHVAVGPEGDVYVSLFDFGFFSVYHSTDAGRSFTAPDFTTGRGLPFGSNGNLTPFSPNGLPNNHFRLQVVRALAADPARPGSVYVAESTIDQDAGGTIQDPGDIVFARSADHGLTWQTTVRLGTQTASVLNDENDGQLARGLKDDVASAQVMPRLVTDAQGDIGVIWYDTRHDPANHLLDVYGTFSTDGGETFSPNFRVTDVSFDADAGKFIDASGKEDFYLGDFIGLAVANHTAYAAWTDTQSGNQDIFFSRFPLTLPPPGTDRFEPNNAAATATDLGQVIHQHLPKLDIPPGDEDWFHLTTAATGNLTISAVQEEAGVSPRLELRDASGATVLAVGTALHDSGGASIGQQIVFPSPAGQTYLVRVLPGPGAAANGPFRYALDVESLTANLGPQVHNVLTNSLNPGDQALYLISAGASGSLQATLTAEAGFQGTLNLEVLNPDTLAVLASGQGSGNGMTQRASLPVQQGQAVLLHVSGDATARGNFTLEFTNLDQFNTPENKTLFFSAGPGPSEVAVADLNGDGKPDLVVSNALTNTVSVLLGNGDGTFQALRQFAVGAFQPTLAGVGNTVPNFGRAVAVADVNRDGIPDIIVTNYASGDVSVLLGRGDGTFQPQRRFDATPSPFALAVGDVNGDGIPDLVVLDSTAQQGKLGILLGRGDGTFQPPLLVPSPLPDPESVAAVKIADLNRDGRNDLLIADNVDTTTHVLLGNGDGTFRPGGDYQSFGPGLAVADLNGDGVPDVVNAQRSTDTVRYVMGNGDGTFHNPQTLPAGQSPYAVAVADFGSAVTLADGSTVLGPPDGHPDLIVADVGDAQPALFGPPAVALLPGHVDAQGRFDGFGAPLTLATPKAPQDLKVADLNGDGVPDIVVVDRDGVLIIFGKQPTIATNTTPQTARNLGTLVHVLEPTQTIVPGHQDAYYTLTVPTEAARGAGDEVLDFSGYFQALEGAGLNMEVLDAAGKALGSGERFRVDARQGQVLTLHVFGVAGADGKRGSGAYTLDIDVLPRVVSVEAQPLLPGVGAQPGGPTASLVVTLQGDRLDPAGAENPANYTVTWLGPDGLPGTPDDQILDVQAGAAGGQPVVYDPSANVEVASGQTFPTAVRQTVTLLFAKPLPAGSYTVALKPAIQAAAFNQDEPNLLAGGDGFAGHPVVALANGRISTGSLVTAKDLVQAAGALGDLSAFTRGTAFLTQLHDDLGALLDAGLTRSGDAKAITAAIQQQIQDRLGPALGAAGARPASVLVLWLDPGGLDLEDSQGQHVTYDPEQDALSNGAPDTFVLVVGNIELVVVAGASGDFTLRVRDIAVTGRGGLVFLGLSNDAVQSLTDALRAGTFTFNFTF
jgi:hypothetical protein